MATIKEDYVSFEIAKLLKEKGFNEPCVWSYDPNSASFAKSYHEPKNSELNVYEYSKPTLQMAMKWLREVHNWNVVIRKSHIIYGYDIYIESLVSYNVIEYGFEKTYEQACEEAIKYCLENLI